MPILPLLKTFATWLIPLLILAVVILRFFRKTPAEPIEIFETPEGTLEDLKRLEADLQRSGVTPPPVPAGFAFVKRFSTLQGFSEPYMVDLCQRLEAQGISCVYHFLPSAIPAGTLGGLPVGDYELYADAPEEALRLL